jgi:zinc protease
VGEAATMARLDPLRPSSAPLGTPFRTPSWLRLRLADGLRVAVARRAAFPVVRLRLLAPAGADAEPPGQEGLAALTTPLLRAGTARRGAGRLAETAETLGTDLVTGFDWETGSLTVDLLREDLEPALDLLLEVAFEPSFPAPAVEASRRTRIGQLRGRAFQPAVLAGDWLARALFGAGRYAASLLGTEAGLARGRGRGASGRRRSGGRSW